MKRSIIILMLASAGIVAGCSSSRECPARDGTSRANDAKFPANCGGYTEGGHL